MLDSTAEDNVELLDGLRKATNP